MAKGLPAQNALHFDAIYNTIAAMPKTKISTLNLRIHPGVKHAVREAASREHRSVANMIEVLIRRHCEQAGIRISETIDPSSEQSSRNDDA